MLTTITAKFVKHDLHVKHEHECNLNVRIIWTSVMSLES